MKVSRELVQRALQLEGFDAAASQRPMSPINKPMHRPSHLPGQARVGAVLLLLYPQQNDLSILLTRRRDDLNAHAGQISFPGGRQDPGESLYQTALREAEEEVGLPPEPVEILGTLAPIYILPSDFEVHPFVGWQTETPILTPSASEVAEIIELPLPLLFDPAVAQREPRTFNGLTVSVPYYALGKHKVWGATAIMLSEFAGRLRAAAALP